MPDCRDLWPSQAEIALSLLSSAMERRDCGEEALARMLEHMARQMEEERNVQANVGHAYPVKAHTYQG